MVISVGSRTADSLLASATPALGPPDSFMQSLRTAASSTFYGHTLLGFDILESNIQEDINARVRAATGKNIMTLMDPTDMGGHERFFDGYFKVVKKAIEEHPELNDMPIQNLEQMRKEIARQVTTREAKSALSSARTTGFLAGTGRFLGAAGGILVDPPIAATLFAGGSFSVGLLRVFAREAGLGFVSELVVQPGVQTTRLDLGLDAGVQQALTNIGLATLGGGIFGTAFAGAARGARALLKTARAKKIPIPKEVQEAADILETLDELDTLLPYVRTADARAAFIRTLDQSVRALRAGRGLDVQRPMFAPTKEAIEKVRKSDIPKDVSEQLPISQEVLGAARNLREQIIREVTPKFTAQRQAQAARTILREPNLDAALDVVRKRASLELKRRQLAAKAVKAKISPQARAAITRGVNALRKEFFESNPQLVGTGGTPTPAGVAVFDAFMAGSDQVSMALRSLEDLGFNLRDLTPDSVRAELETTAVVAERTIRSSKQNPAISRAIPADDDAAVDAITASHQRQVEEAVEAGDDFDVVLDDEVIKASKISEDIAEDERALTAAKKCGGGT